MTLPASGVIKLSQVRTERSASGAQNLAHADCRTMAVKPSGVIKMSDLYGKSLLPANTDTIMVTSAAGNWGGGPPFSYGYEGGIPSGSVLPTTWRGFNLNSLSWVNGTLRFNIITGGLLPPQDYVTLTIGGVSYPGSAATTYIENSSNTTWWMWPCAVNPFPTVGNVYPVNLTYNPPVITSFATMVAAQSGQYVGWIGPSYPYGAQTGTLTPSAWTVQGHSIQIAVWFGSSDFDDGFSIGCTGDAGTLRPAFSMNGISLLANSVPYVNADPVFTWFYYRLTGPLIGGMAAGNTYTLGLKF
jgi:hypothetical protein